MTAHLSVMSGCKTCAYVACVVSLDDVVLQYGIEGSVLSLRYEARLLLGGHCVSSL
jgi:hypothetical protein